MARSAPGPTIGATSGVVFSTLTNAIKLRRCESVSEMPGHHLGRLSRVWLRQPVFFLTVCTQARRFLLAEPRPAGILCEEWRAAEDRHGWRIGRYVIMPYHVHFFATPMATAKPLELFVGRWKEWTAKAIGRATVIALPLWQHRFFDHVLRSTESYAEKWEYVRQNPVRAGLATQPDGWPYAGSIHFDSWDVS